MEYPLEVESVGSDTYIVMSRGHHDLEQFMAAVMVDYSGWFLGGPQHVWVKSVPDRRGEFTSRYVFVERGARGAWPATYCWEYGEEYKRYNSLYE